MTMVDSFVDWAHNNLHESEDAQNYLSGRGVSDFQFKKHKIGFVLGCFSPDTSVDPSHSDLCFKKGLVHKWCDSCRFMRWSSLCEEDGDGKKYTVGKRILGCVVLPITSYSGQSVGFQIRSIHDKKYDSFFILRRPEAYFFGIAPNMDLIWSSKNVNVVEGPFDHLIFERLISSNVVALLTSTPNTGQVSFFNRFVDKISLFLDNDKAGKNGSNYFIDNFTDKRVINFMYHVKNDIRKCNAKDLNEIWSKLGDKVFSKEINGIIERYSI